MHGYSCFLSFFCVSLISFLFHSLFFFSLVILFSGYGRKAMHKTLCPDIFDRRTNTCHKLVSYERTNTITSSSSSSTTKHNVIQHTFFNFIVSFPLTLFNTIEYSNAYINIALSRCGMPILLAHAHTYTHINDTVLWSLKMIWCWDLAYATEYTISPVWIRQRQNEATLHVTCTRSFFQKDFLFLFLFSHWIVPLSNEILSHC